MEVSSTEVTALLVPSRKASMGSTYNSGENIVTTPALSEVDERPNLGMLASPLSTQERSAAPFRNYHSNKEFCVMFITRSYQYRETCDDVLT